MTGYPEISADAPEPAPARRAVEPGVLRRAARGGVLLGIGQALVSASTWLTTLILARLLAPQDFGLVGMATIILGFCTTWSDLGLSAALIQRSELEEAHKDAAFWASVLMGVTLFLLAAAAAPFLALLYREPRVTLLVIVSALTLILGPFSAIHAALLRRALKFGAVARVEFVRSAANGVSAIGAAALGCGYWSIVIGMLVGGLVAIPAYHIANDSWRPRMRCRREHARHLLSFSLFVAGANAVNYLSANVDYMVVGRFLGSFELGIYMLAYQLMTFPLTKITSLFTQVMFPAFSAIQTDSAQMRVAYVKITRSVALISFPVLSWAAVTAPELLTVAYGDKWLPAVPVLRLLSVAGAMKSVGSLVGIVFKSHGKPHVELYWNMFWVVAITLGVLVGVRWGSEGVAAAVSVLCVPGVLYTEWLACRYLGLPFRQLLSCLVLPTAAALLAACLGMLLRGSLEHVTGAGLGFTLLRLGVLTALVLAAYSGLLRLLSPSIGQEARAFWGYLRKA